MSNNDALREALIFAASWIESGRPIDGLAQRMREAASKPDPYDIHSCSEVCDRPECVAAREASKPEPQAQVGEPEVVQYQYQSKSGEWHNFINQKHYDDTVAAGGWQIRALITLQSHREAMETLQAERDTCERQADYWQNEAANFAVAIAKRDAALDACVEALRIAITQNGHDMLMTGEEQRIAIAAITQAQEARK